MFYKLWRRSGETRSMKDSRKCEAQVDTVRTALAASFYCQGEREKFLGSDRANNSVHPKFLSFCLWTELDAATPNCACLCGYLTAPNRDSTAGCSAITSVWPLGGSGGRLHSGLWKGERGPAHTCKRCLGLSLEVAHLTPINISMSRTVIRSHSTSREAEKCSLSGCSRRNGEHRF